MSYHPRLAIQVGLVLLAVAACQRPSSEQRASPGSGATAENQVVEHPAGGSPASPADASTEAENGDAAISGEPGSLEEPMRITNGVQPPRRLAGSAVDLHKANCLGRTRWRSPIIVEAVVTQEGRVSNIRMLKPAPVCIEEYLRSTFSQWRFEPATHLGVPVSVYHTLTVHIHLQ